MMDDLSVGSSSAPSAFTAGFVFALVACGGVLAERLTHGDPRIAAVVHVLFTAAVLVIAARRDATAANIVAQLVGASFGIVVAHALVRSQSFAAPPWLSERPAQLVNDAVVVFAPLAIVAASTRRPPSTLALVVILSLVTLYRLTAPLWHLDAGDFRYTVQELVTVELACAALGLAAFRWFVPARC
jgi:hypothetical protein